MRVLRWEKPPPSASEHPRGGRASQWDAVAAELRDMAGTWAVIYEGSAARVAALVNNIRSGTLACFSPAGSFEAASRSAGPACVTVYARFVGDEGEAES